MNFELLQNLLPLALALGLAMAVPAAIALAAWIFALIHQDPQATLQLFALGVAFGWVRWRSGAWEGAFCSHFLWNLSTFLFVSLA